MYINRGEVLLSYLNVHYNKPSNMHFYFEVLFHLSVYKILYQITQDKTLILTQKLKDAKE